MGAPGAGDERTLLDCTIPSCQNMSEVVRTCQKDKSCFAIHLAQYEAAQRAAVPIAKAEELALKVDTKHKERQKATSLSSALELY